MDDELPINPFTAILAQKTVVAAVVFFLLAPAINDSRNQSPPIVVKPLISHDKLSPSVIEKHCDAIARQPKIGRAHV